MDKNLIAFFDDGISDPIRENPEVLPLLNNLTNNGFSFIFQKYLDDGSIKNIKNSKNTFAFINPYWNTNVDEIKEQHLLDLLNSLCNLSNETPDTNIFIIPYTTCLLEPYGFYRYINQIYKNNLPPENLFISEEMLIIDHHPYHLADISESIIKIVKDKFIFKDIYGDVLKRFKMPATFEDEDTMIK